jgi:Leucine-rich repeat (LRR) protein
MDNEIQLFLDSLPSNKKKINLNNSNLIHLPDLSRFVNLQELRCSNNKLTTLPPLNHTLQYLYCCDNELTSLPELNSNLQGLYCSNNKLTRLPKLNHNLQFLLCSNNKLTRLPKLNHNLLGLNCEFNTLNHLPNLNDMLYTIYYENTPIFNIINSVDIDIIRSKLEKINSFKYFYYLLKYKNKFRDWLWIRVREPKIRLLYSPANLNILLDNMIDIEDEEEFQNKINNW